jgi:hypothetical protein
MLSIAHTAAVEASRWGKGYPHRPRRGRMAGAVVLRTPEQDRRKTLAELVATR